MPKPFRCKIPNCAYPNEGKKGTHEARYHSGTHEFDFNGTKKPVTRDKVTQLIPCPCGSPIHARCNFMLLYKLCGIHPHPAPDENPFPEKPRASSIPNQRPNRPKPDLPHSLAPGIVDPSGSCSEFYNPLPATTSNDAENAVLQDVSPSWNTGDEAGTSNSSAFNVVEAMDVDGPVGGNVSSISGQAPENDNNIPPRQSGIQVEEVDNDGNDDEDYYSEDEEDAVDHEAMVVDDTDSGPTEFAKLQSSLFLSQYNVHVDPTFHLTICTECRKPVSHSCIHSHQRDHHFSSRTIPKELRLPSPDIIHHHLKVLGADHPQKLPSRPIPPLQGVDTFKGYKCMTEGCGAVKRAWSTLKEHLRKGHPSVPVARRSHIGVDCQPSGGYRGILTYVEVRSIVPLVTAARQQMQALADDCDLLNPSDTFNVSDNAREKNPVFSQTKWDEILNGVNMGVLMRAALKPDTSTEPTLERLRLLLRSHYEDIVELIPSLPILTRRYLLSYNPDNDLKAQPFRRPQERGTVLRDSDCMAQFLSFLIRTENAPVEGFPVVLHPETRGLLLSLVSKLKDETSNDEEVKLTIHATVWSLLSSPSLEYRQNELMCPFTRFLIAANIRDSKGTFVKPQLISPTIARAQWCFRATAVQELIRIRDEFNGDVHRAYEERVKRFITDKHAVLFTTLRQHMKYFSALAYRQQGLARFNFNPEDTVVSMDGFPIVVHDISSGINNSLKSTYQGMERVFRKCEFGDILHHIDEGMNPDESARDKWFADVPHQDKCRYSLLEEARNGFGPYRDRLLDHLLVDPDLFSFVDGVSTPKRGAIFEWFSQVNDLVKELYFLVCATWGGGARGTETEHLLYANHPRRHRNIFFMNGFLTIVTEYNKTQSITGVGKTIARSPAFAVSRLLLLLLSVVYYAAGHLALCIGMSKKDAQRYFYEVFVLSGSSMTSEKFSAALGAHTANHLGIHLGLRDFRQLMALCLVRFARSSFYDTDDEDMDLSWLHHAFGHSKEVAETHYGLEICNSGHEMTTTSIASMQRVSSRWHKFIEQLHPALMKKLKPRIEGPRASTELGQLDEALKSHFALFASEMKNLLMSFEERVIATIRREFETLGTQLINVITPAGKPITLSSPTRASVHPRISQALSELIRRPLNSPLRFSSPEQAEIINSAGSSLHVLGVIETGGGKSLAFFGATRLFPDHLFIVVSPLNALTNDLERRMLEFGIRGGRWGSPNLDFHSAQIILVSAHVAGTQEFSIWLESNAVKKRLKRVFIDECHKILTDRTYRSCFGVFWYLTKAGFPITFLSATIMPRSIPDLLDSMKIMNLALVEEHRRYTGRPNLKYEVERINEKDYIQEVKSRVDRIVGTMQPDERCLVYTRTIPQAKSISRVLGTPLYISVLDSDPVESHRLKDEAEERWRTGACAEDRVMAATQAFGNGIDYPKTSYGYTPPDRARFDKPLARVSNTTNDDEPVAATVETNAMEIQQVFDGVVQQLEVLKGVLERIMDVGCVDCWIMGRSHTETTEHDRSAWFSAHFTQIRQVQLTYDKHWPYCFHCWVPLRQPLNHPPPTPEQPLNRERCSFRPFDVVSNDHLPVIPWIIAFVFGCTETRSNGKTLLKGVEDALGVRLKKIGELCDWLSIPMTDLSELPNPIRFVVTLYDLYFRLPDAQ
ncbi:hypothetical protein AAF712_013070 [Marasmius tenuissimus]|uniref:Helicase ATP-binding domain-containing protein n=1 Tax=Marasmius tenuissimus TaxID=585030 RepID=A0ABR2ZGQ9_9AGAR